MKLTVGMVALLCALTAAPEAADSAHRVPEFRGSEVPKFQVPQFQRSDGLTREVLDLALRAVSSAVAQRKMTQPPTLTVIDFSRPSTEPRLWVIDLETGELLFRELVAHGKNSGGNLASHFSNEPESQQSSLGLYVTADAYTGSKGYALRLNGLEPGFNDRARERAIVIHAATYVDQKTAAGLGRLGRSWGCPALRPAITHQVIDRIKGGSAVFAYYPDPAWLARSPFLSHSVHRAD